MAFSISTLSWEVVKARQEQDHDEVVKGLQRLRTAPGKTSASTFQL